MRKSATNGEWGEVVSIRLTTSPPQILLKFDVNPTYFAVGFWWFEGEDENALDGYWALMFLLPFLRIRLTRQKA